MRPLNPSSDPSVEHEKALYSLYETGQVSAAQYHHLKDREYEEIHGMRSPLRRRVGKATTEETDVISAFVEEVPGERESRLRGQVQRDLGAPDEWDDEGISGKDGEVIMLHHMDRRAVEFRERMRTW